MTLDLVTARSLREMFENAIPRTAKALPFVAVVSAILAGGFGSGGMIAGLFLLGTAITILIASAVGLVLLGCVQLVAGEKAVADAIDDKSDPGEVRKLLLFIQIVALGFSVADFYVFHLPYYPYIIFFVIFAGIGVYQRWVAEHQKAAGKPEAAIELTTAAPSLPATKRTETRAVASPRAGKPPAFGRRTA